MIKQIKRKEPKSHSWPAKIFYKHQQTIRNESFTSEIKPRTPLAGSRIRPEVLKLSILKKSIPIPSRKGPNFWPLCPPSLNLLYPCLVQFSKAPLSSASQAITTTWACTTHQSNSTPCIYGSPTRGQARAYSNGPSSESFPPPGTMVYNCLQARTLLWTLGSTSGLGGGGEKWKSWTRRPLRFLVLYFQADMAASVKSIGVSPAGTLPKVTPWGGGGVKGSDIAR